MFYYIYFTGTNVAATMQRARVPSRKRRAIGDPFADFNIDINAVPTVNR